jgi:hypothetical protein
MATAKQRGAARANIEKAQAASESMPSRHDPLIRPEGKRRKKPGATGEGEFYHIEIRPKTEFSTFRTQDIGEKGGIERVAGKRSSGSWDTQKWLINKKLAHIEGDKLIADTQEVREVLDRLGSEPKHIDADRFVAQPEPNVPESEKPTPAQTKARRENIKKAQSARRGH